MPQLGREEPLTVPRWFITAPVWVGLIVLSLATISLISTGFEWDEPVFVVLGVLVLAFGVLVALIMRRAYYMPPRYS